MKNIHYKLFVLLFTALAFPLRGFSQASSVSELRFEVKRVYPYISLTKEKINEALTLVDLNKQFKASWIRDYITVEIVTNDNGRIRTAVSKNNTLSQEQKENMQMADVGTDISVKVRYIPENTLKNNDIKEINFAFTPDPESEAKYPGGAQQLNQYIKHTMIDKIPTDSFKDYDLAAIYFTIDEEGHISDAHIFESAYQSFKNEKIEKLLLETIRNMPHWEPARYSNGTKVKQEFVLTVGNIESCVSNLINSNQE